MSTILLGYGPDGEEIKLAKVHDLCWLIHCTGNTESPFEFMSQSDAREFANFLIFQRIGEL